MLMIPPFPPTEHASSPPHQQFTAPKTTDYVGRFAPSPTGPLHFGSLISAVASYLDARAHGGRWLLRIEDIDPLRQPNGAIPDILECLQSHGLLWDGEVLYQSQRLALYQQAALDLLDQHLAFYCTCSRSALAGYAVYPGHCRRHDAAPAQPYAIRLQVNTQQVAFEDAIQGQFEQQLDRDVGDFVIFRKEQLPAYQLAVVIDDAEQGITHVVRGCDLLDNTPRQIFLQQCLQLPTPRYAHVPVITNMAGQKLSKQTGARMLDNSEALSNLRAALDFLGQPPLPATVNGNIRSLLAAAVAQWSLAAIPHVRSLAGEELPLSCRQFAA